MEFWLEWAKGPAFIFSFSFMTLGLARQIGLTLWEIHRVLRRAGDKDLPIRQIAWSTLQWLFPFDKIARDPLFSATSILFHIAILIVPLFLAGHVALWRRSVGLSWPAIPAAFADILTIAAVALAVALVVERLAAKPTRALSRFGDYALPIVIAAPFISGFMVAHPVCNPLPYPAILFLHIMSSNLLMMLMPITKLAHAALLPGVQLIAELGWRWPSDAGSKVAVELGREEARL
jgi:nitrate reductase gamma subunit